MQTIENISKLRQLLADRFPHLRRFPELPADKRSACLPTGLPQIDRLLDGGLRKGEIIELTGAGPGAGSLLMLFVVLLRAGENAQWAGLIDGQDSFDPTPLESTVLSRLLWVRCHNATEALKAADLLIRDGNLPLVLLDLKINPAAQLRRIPATTWYRWQRIIERRSTTLLVVTPWPMVCRAKARLTLTSHFTLESLEREPEELLAELRVALIASRHHQKENL
jgi:hypothetical protein